MRKISYQNEPAKVNFYSKIHAKTLKSTEFKQFYNLRKDLHKKIEKNNYITDMNNYQDTMSHFASRIVNSEDEDSARTFIFLESQNFAKKLDRLNNEEREKIFKTEFYPFLANLSKHGNITQETVFDPYRENKNKIENIRTLKFHFSKVHDAITKDSVPEKGFFKFSDEILTFLMVNEFTDFLTRQMKEINNKIYSMNKARFLDKIKSDKPGGVEILEQNKISKVLKNLPPCMDNLIHKLRKNRHLKYGDRPTIERFFVGTGVDVDEAVDFLKNSFKNTTAEFIKEYSYNIRHHYGLEGKRVRHSMWSCLQMVSKTSDPMAVGCAISDYKKGKESTLKEYCDRAGVTEDIEDILNKPSCLESCQVIFKSLNKESKEFQNPSEFTNLLIKKGDTE